MFLEDLVEDSNITLQDAFGDMLSNTRLTFLIAGKPYCGSASTAASESADNMEPGELESDVKEDLKLLMMRYSLLELAAANCPFSKGLLSQIQHDKYVSCISAEKQRAFKVWLADFRAQQKSLDAAKILKSETPVQPQTVQYFPQPPRPYQTSPAAGVNSTVVTQRHHLPGVQGGTDRGPRYRTSFDPVTELPLLKSWFQTNTSPDNTTIQQYTNILNSREGRGNKRPLDDYSIKIWFKNARAKYTRENTKIYQDSVEIYSSEAHTINEGSVQNCSSVKVQVSS